MNKYSMFEKTYSLKLYLTHTPILIMIVISVLLNVLSWFWILFQITPSSEPIFLSYNILFGVNEVGLWWKLLYMPLFGLLVLFVNSIIGWMLFHKETLYAYLFLATCVVAQLFVFVATWTLVRLNV